MNPNSEPWLTKRELAAALKVSPKTIERIKPPCLRVGRQNRYLRSEVETFLRGGTYGANVIPLHQSRRAS